jgi:ribulose-5-phosphate 4-epimerase/fuculose-1-phosphate aldolase
LTVGTSVDSAAWWYITGERSAEVQLAAYSAGTPRLIDHEVATRTCRYVGSEVAGAFSFHPLWSWIISEEPDLLDE